VFGDGRVGERDRLVAVQRVARHEHAVAAQEQIEHV
jgi:hypothetical protein